MDRRSFFKGIGIVSAGIVVAPVVAAEVMKEVMKEVPAVKGTEGLWAYVQRTGNTYSFASPIDVLKLWRESGILLYKAYTPPVYLLTEKAAKEMGGITLKTAEDD